MNYVLALVLPPLPIAFAGRPFVGVFVFLIWLPAILFSGGLTRPMFILLAWFPIFSAEQKGRERAD